MVTGMRNEKIFFYSEDDSVYLETYISEQLGDYTRNAILILPGGTYGTLSKREGEPIAQAFIPYGYNAFVLNYSVGRKRPFPVQLIEVSRAIKHIKDNAKQYHINPDRVFVLGFSAGGHLAASLGTMWDLKKIYEEIDMPYGYNRPTGMMLIYSVINGYETFANQATFCNLLCTDNPKLDDLYTCSVDKNIKQNTVPAFLVHTSNDEMVNVKNSLAMANALEEKGHKFELHIYPDGPHGMALGNAITECGNSRWNNIAVSKWVEQAVLWAKNI